MGQVSKYPDTFDGSDAARGPPVRCSDSSGSFVVISSLTEPTPLPPEGRALHCTISQTYRLSIAVFDPPRDERHLAATVLAATGPPVRTRILTHRPVNEAVCKTAQSSTAASGS